MFLSEELNFGDIRVKFLDSDLNFFFRMKVWLKNEIVIMGVLDIDFN